MPRFVQKSILTGSDGTPYLTRWRARLGPLGSIRVHHFHRPDCDPDLHDHPWPFVSIILRGWYVEELGGCREKVTRRAGSVAYRQAAIPHRVASMTASGCWTLLWTGRARRRWGFYTRAGWMPWRDYVGAPQP